MPVCVLVTEIETHFFLRFSLTAASRILGLWTGVGGRGRGVSLLVDVPSVDTR